MSRILSASIGLVLLVAAVAFRSAGWRRSVPGDQDRSRRGRRQLGLRVRRRGRRRVYIPRRGTAAVAATDTRPATPGDARACHVFNLDTLEPIGQVDGVTGAGAVIDP